MAINYSSKEDMGQLYIALKECCGLDDNTIFKVKEAGFDLIDVFFKVEKELFEEIKSAMIYVGSDIKDGYYNLEAFSACEGLSLPEDQSEEKKEKQRKREIEKKRKGEKEKKQKKLIQYLR